MNQMNKLKQLRYTRHSTPLLCQLLKFGHLIFRIAEK